MSKLNKYLVDINHDFFNDGKFAKSGKKESDFDSEEIKLGMIVEAEHSSNNLVKKKIVLDHLTDNPRYYSEGRDKGLFDELK